MLKFFLLVALAFLVLRVMFSLAGDHDTGDGGDGDDGGHDSGESSSIFTLRNFTHFGIGYGATGALATNLGSGSLAANVYGILGGVLLAVLAGMLFGAIRRQQANSVSNIELLVGKQGRVITAIPNMGVGQIQTQDQFGTTAILSAQSQGGALDQGSQVEITSVAAGTVIVAAVG